MKHCPKCKSGVEVINKSLIDSQSLILEENPDMLENSADQPKRINILLQGDLVSPWKDSKTNPGTIVNIVGLVREVPIPTRTGSESINYDLVIDGNAIELAQQDFTDIVITPEDEKKIQEIAARDDTVEYLVKNTAPSIYGYSKIKEALLLQLFGGSATMKGDGIRTRGDIHVLLIGDPGVAKSQLMRAATKMAPKASFVSGKSASGVGLTATVLRDELTRGWALEAGALVLSSGGLCAVDEMDKMTEEDTSSMHEALEQQSISIAKANIRATLKCQTVVLGAANPKHGRFDPYGDIGKQINFPPALLSRFDLIFILRDLPNVKKDDLIANHILQTHKKRELTIAELDTDFFKKYISYAKRLNPQLTQDAIEIIRSFYVNMRKSSQPEDGEIKSVPITARQLEAIVRIAQGYAKMKLCNTVTKEFAQQAIDMIMYCLEKIGIDPKTGELDIDRIATGITSSSRNAHRQVMSIIETLSTEQAEMTFDDIMAKAEEKKIGRDDVTKVLEKLRTEGIIFEPRRNVYKKL